MEICCLRWINSVINNVKLTCSSAYSFVNVSLESLHVGVVELVEEGSLNLFWGGGLLINLSLACAQDAQLCYSFRIVTMLLLQHAAPQCEIGQLCTNIHRDQGGSQGTETRITPPTRLPYHMTRLVTSAKEVKAAHHILTQLSKVITNEEHVARTQSSIEDSSNMPDTSALAVNFDRLPFTATTVSAEEIISALWRRSNKTLYVANIYILLPSSLVPPTGTLSVTSTMANNTTFILPEWLLAKEPGMTCRPHSTIIVMLAIYNIISSIISIMTSSTFFFCQWAKIQQWLLSCIFYNENYFEHLRSEYYHVQLSFLASFVGSIIISLSAPLAAGFSIAKNHPDANRWVLIEQWSTRPRATFFVYWFNIIGVLTKHRGVIHEGSRPNSNEQLDGYLTTALCAMMTEIVVSLFGMRFLWEQAAASPLTFDPSLPCTSLGTYTEGPSNCPIMQIGDYGLIVCIVVNAVLGIVYVIFVLGNKMHLGSFVVLSLASSFCTFLIYLESWIVWANFLDQTSEGLYCVENSMAVDIIYCLLPVVLGLWRLMWAVSGM